ncbi:hypothetical protein CLOM_g156 [Closterium sp. NIES-68]|nr:hypothetical protein CLOM_g156 [Closterium sp. NIES-68]
MLSGRNDTLRVCCPSTGPVQDTQVAPLPVPTLPISSQGLQVQWDVLNANASQYSVAVRVTNTQRYTAVSSDPGWSLQWAWQMGEMILECDGCQTLQQGDCTSCPACIDNPSINSAYSCDPIPTLIDGSPLNGSLSAPAYDNSSSSTSFTMLLVKARQYWDPSLLTFPANFTARVSNQSQGFACDPPTGLSPSALETVVGGRQTRNAKASYVVTCGTVAGNGPLPTCSVSASAYFNSSLAPSSSCACGCSSSNTSQGGGQCDAATSASTDPAATVLLGEDLAGLVVPGQSEGSCGTGCGIEAHVTISDADETGWTMRLALWNSAPPTIKNWTAVLAFPQGFAENLQEATSVAARFDSPPYADNLMMSGQPTVNEWLLGDGGNVQWTLRFNRTPGSAGYNATGGDTLAVSSGVFPLALLVGGQQCQMPAFLPSAKGAWTGGGVWSVAVAVVVWAVLGI